MLYKFLLIHLKIPITLVSYYYFTLILLDGWHLWHQFFTLNLGFCCLPPLLSNRFSCFHHLIPVYLVITFCVDTILKNNVIFFSQFFFFFFWQLVLIIYVRDSILQIWPGTFTLIICGIGIIFLNKTRMNLSWVIILEVGLCLIFVFFIIKINWFFSRPMVHCV